VLAAERQSHGLFLIHNDWETLCDVNYDSVRDGVEKMASATWNVDLFGDGSLREDW